MLSFLPTHIARPKRPAAAWPFRLPGRGCAGGRSRWLHLLWVCTVFSALHGLLGAWVVPAVASGPVAEICTPTGMQWVVLDDAPAPDKSWPKGLAQPCVWAMAHVATPPSPLDSQLPPGWITRPGVPFDRSGQRAARLPATADRVLLMAPMRAPPSA